MTDYLAQLSSNELLDVARLANTYPYTAELDARYDSRQSFYGKAHVEAAKTKRHHSAYRVDLRSYDTIVAHAFISKSGGVSKIIVNGDYSPTTLRHIKEFLKQLGVTAKNKRQILADYYESEA